MWYIIPTLAILFTLAVVACMSVVIVFILSKQEAKIEDGMDKKQTNQWRESEEDDLNFNGRVEFKGQNELIKGNLIIKKHVQH